MTREEAIECLSERVSIGKTCEQSCMVGFSVNINTLDEALDDIEGGIKSAMCYIGARQLKNIPKNCTFYKVHNQLNTKFADCKHIR